LISSNRYFCFYFRKRLLVWRDNLLNRLISWPLRRG
jgi:hypothetical protein